MSERKILIVGIDPGTTLGYAIIDTQGNLIKTGSSKNMDLGSLISDIVGIGKAVVVGTDKRNVPEFVQNFATKTGARLEAPKYDLGTDEKRELISDYNIKNIHQIDALASALFAYREIRPLLKKIDVFARHNKKEEIKDKIKELVLLKKISIKSAADIIERPEKEEVRIIKKIIKGREFCEDDFFKLYNKLKRQEKEASLLKEQNQKLIKAVHSLKEKNKRLEKKMDHFRSSQKVEERLNFKEKRIMAFDKEIKEKDNKVNLLKEEIKNITEFLFDIDNIYILKKLKNLCSIEFQKGMNDIKKGDFLFVDDANLFNGDVVENLRGKVRVIVSKKDINETTKKALPFILIEIKNLKIKEEENFAVIRKTEIEREIRKADILKNILEEYKKERVFVK